MCVNMSEEKGSKDSESEHINLKVLGQDNAVMQFKDKNTYSPTEADERLLRSSGPVH